MESLSLDPCRRFFERPAHVVIHNIAPLIEGPTPEERDRRAN